MAKGPEYKVISETRPFTAEKHVVAKNAQKSHFSSFGSLCSPALSLD
jgi:hypothetical protein